MLTKNKIKLINSLDNKKNRKETGLFVVEGEKNVAELLQSNFEIVEIYCLAKWHKQHNIIFDKLFEVSEAELKKISFLSTPNQVLALVKIPQYKFNFDNLEKKLIIGLENIQDPGNLGTIIRTADWFGIKNIICSPQSVNVFNPKTIQATMGAFMRTQIFYFPLIKFIKDLKKEKKDFPIYGTFLQGQNIYKEKLTTNGLVLFGNESIGLSAEIESLVEKKLFIPNFSFNNLASSLNIAIATGVICSEFKRNSDFK